tara:strand:- start:10526 stop:12013 length:1488 start_codon:yes stop_codon:yes gene_type:complete
MFYKFFVLAYSFFFITSVQSQTFENTELCQKAYKNIIALKLDSGLHYLKAEKLVNPSNNYVAYLKNYIDFLVVFTSGDMTHYEEKVKANFYQRIDLIQNSETENSRYFLYIQAEIYLHSAILSVMNKDYFVAVTHLRKALKKLEQNVVKFPKFKENKKSLGLLYSILGSVPDNLKTGLAVIGLNGDINKGMSWLKELSSDTTFINQHETATIYAFMLFHLNNEKEQAWQVLKENNFFGSQNLMDKYSIAHIGIYGYHNEEALMVLDSINIDSNYIDFPMINYLTGIAKTYRQDDDANFYFKKFIGNYKGIDYLKSTYQKMAWNELIKGNDELYFNYIKQLEQHGRKLIDADKQAAKEKDLLVPPDIVLLQARLLSDGKYTEEARAILEQYTQDDFLMPKNKMEYQYRLGRIYQKEDKLDSAIFYFQKTLDIDNQVEAYFTANACYLIGYIYEQKKEKDTALTYYQKSYKMNGYEYDNSIKQKAKAGINRLNKNLW